MREMIAMLVMKEAYNPKIRWHGAPKICKRTVEMVDFNPEDRCLVARIKVRWMKIARKRFIRLLMAMGVEAREAEWYANEANKRGVPYIAALSIFMEMENDEESEEEPEEEPEHLEDISPEELAELEEELRAEAEKAAEMNIQEGSEIRIQGENNG